MLLLGGACSTTPGPPVPATPPGTQEPSGEDTGQGTASDLPPTDPDVMYHVFAAETLGAKGEFSAAAAAYLEAALISEDPEIAERATRVAVTANEWQMVALASDRWATLAPTSLDARQLAAGSRLREGDYAGAEYQLARLLELTIHDQQRGWHIVTTLLAPVPDKDRANRILNNLLTEFDAGSNVDALFARSQFAAHAGDLDEAARLADDAVRLEPGRFDLLAWSGRLAVFQDNQALALQRYRQAWELRKDDKRIAMAYAQMLKEHDDLETAQAVLAQLTDTPEMRFSRIVFAMDGDDLDGAQSLYEQFTSVEYPDRSEAAFQAAQSAELLERPVEAIDWYRQVSGDRMTLATLRQAYLYAELDNLQQARDLLTGLRDQTDNTVVSQSYQVETQILQDAGLEQESMNTLDAGLQRLPQDTQLLYARALLAVNLGRLAQAEDDLRQIIALEPENAAALNALGYSLADLTDRFEEAEQLILKAYELQPRDASIIDSMGWIAYRLGRLAEAEEYLREAWASLQNAEIAAHLGEVLWVRGQQQQARDIWKSGKGLEADNRVLLETLKRFGETP